MVIWSPGITIRELEKQVIQAALRVCDGHRENTAKMLGITDRTIYSKLRRYEAEQVCQTAADALAKEKFLNEERTGVGLPPLPSKAAPAPSKAEVISAVKSGPREPGRAPTKVT